MSENAFFWIAGIFAVIVGAIGGALWRHITEDARIREEHARGQGRDEAILNRLEEEIDKIRLAMHDFKDENKRATYDLITDRLDRFRDEVRRIIKEEK